MIDLTNIFKCAEYQQLINNHGYGPYNHLYLRYPIKKKSGKLRWLNPPIEPLKSVQTEFLEKVIPLIPTHPAAMGFKKGTSVIDGAKAHLDSKVLLTLDLEDFFNNINTYQIANVCKKLANSLSSMDLIEDCDYYKIVGFFVNLVQGPKGLSQGAPTSPGMSNLVAMFLDRDLQKVADKRDLVYTRYADDLTFSSKDSSINMDSRLKEIQFHIKKQNFIINPYKTRIQRKHKRMSVTGIVVNDKLSVPKWKWRQFRAKLHNIERDKRILTTTELEEIIGYAQWIKQLHPMRGKTFQAQIGRIKSFQP